VTNSHFYCSLIFLLEFKTYSCDLTFCKHSGWRDFLLNFQYVLCYTSIQGVPGGKVNILGGHSIGHSKQKTLYEHVSYSERFPR
jgi:hypothetical protein